MKARIKFSKTGNLKFIGHLDVMRYFQKLIRRAKLDVTYSQGFHPHQIMSFTSPLSVGVESVGEYFDLETNSHIDPEFAVKVMNENTVEGIEVLNYIELPDDAKKSMALLAGADYLVDIDFNEDIINDSKYDCLKGLEKNFETLKENLMKKNDERYADMLIELMKNFEIVYFNKKPRAKRVKKN